ncbi:XrtA system polysaccharide chain length determinant [Colwellia sp. Bg11-28]|uniref:XrtA system polysaccharide chain length determinant n=1 Tax=Colwellia sp. Bg11-28 TaxID=2058305 RepID=UPI000C31DF0A|nr:XrtA system polysaccharide chain length determinant [Colwellia sp. Bg11-28]PKH86083.1 chain length determinant family protein [Colwellia sp. Bg11-28]
MQDIFEEIIDYLKGIWLKRRYIIIATWLICPIGWYFVAAMPNVYQSEARVYVDTQSLLRPLLKGLTVETNPNTQIRLMVKTLLSRPNLERISRMTDLDVQASNSAQYEAIIKNLKDNIKISGVGRENIYTLSIEDKNPEMAKNIVRSALTVFIENTLGETRSDSDSAQKFLNTQIKDYENRLSNSEARLTSFKQKYSGILPDQSGGYYAKLNGNKEKLKAIELDLLENKTRLDSAKKQLAQSVVADNGSDNKIESESSIRTTYDDRINELEVQLDNLKLRYTDKHPDVIEISRNLEHLNKSRSAEIEKYLAQNNENTGSLKRLSANPVIQEVQIQVNQLENLIASLNVRADNYRQRIIELENRVHTLPEIEAELIALNRGYGITKSKYEELLSRKETAQLAQQADETTDKIQFRVIDPPRKATKPSGPKRFILFGVVTLLGFGVGIGLSLLMSQLNPVATSTAQLSKITGVPIFGVISANENLGLQRWHQKKTFIFIGSNLLLLCLLLLFVSYFVFPNIIQVPLKRIF